MNHTTYAYDLCASTRRALAAIPFIAPVPGYLLGIELARSSHGQSAVHGQFSQCRLKMSIVDPAGQSIAVVNGEARVVGADPRLMMRDCIDAVLEHYLRGKVIPALQLHLNGPVAPLPPPPWSRRP